MKIIKKQYFTFEEIRRFCVDRGIIQDDAAENLSNVGSPAPQTLRRPGRPAGSAGKSKCSVCGEPGHYRTACPQYTQKEQSGEASSGEGSGKVTGKRTQTDTETDAGSLRKVSRTLDMGSPARAAGGAAASRAADDLSVGTDDVIIID